MIERIKLLILDSLGRAILDVQGMTSAQRNLPYCVATLLLDGDVLVDQFTEDKVADPDRMRIAAKVSVAEDPAITARGSRIATWYMSR